MHEIEGAPPEGGKSANFKAVYTIIDRGEGRKPFWLRVGTAWTNRDQSINVRLDANPNNGTLNIRDYTPWDARRNDESAPWRAQNGADR
jgi:hypothetical protein